MDIDKQNISVINSVLNSQLSNYTRQIQEYMST